jgi:hypothetical protein
MNPSSKPAITRTMGYGVPSFFASQAKTTTKSSSSKNTNSTSEIQLFGCIARSPCSWNPEHILSASARVISQNLRNVFFSAAPMGKLF